MDPIADGLNSVIRLKNIEIARLKKELATAQREAATLRYERAELELILETAKSETGKELFTLTPRSLTNYLETADASNLSN